VAFKPATARRESVARQAALAGCRHFDRRHNAPDPDVAGEVAEARRSLARDLDALASETLLLPG
jgi:hypothetical protein